MILIVPPGGQDAPIAYGDRQFHSYREVYTDPQNRWLVDIPDEIAAHFVVSGLGFWPADPEVAKRFGRR